MKKGDIVLIPFPFSDLSGAKNRPAVILIETDEFQSRIGVLIKRDCLVFMRQPLFIFQWFYLLLITSF